MNIYEKYYFNLLADNGIHTISIVATNKETAKSIIMDAEGCPERAIEFVKKKRI